jgi:hypothetical protein
MFLLYLWKRSKTEVRLFSEEETFFPTELLTAFIMELCIVLNISESFPKAELRLYWYSYAALQHKFP